MAGLDRPHSRCYAHKDHTPSLGEAQPVRQRRSGWCAGAPPSLETSSHPALGPARGADPAPPRGENRCRSRKAWVTRLTADSRPEGKPLIGADTCYLRVQQAGTPAAARGPPELQLSTLARAPTTPAARFRLTLQAADVAHMARVGGSKEEFSPRILSQNGMGCILAPHGALWETRASHPGPAHTQGCTRPLRALKGRGF